MNSVNKRRLLKSIPAELDVDGFHSDSPFAPCTPEGIIDLINDFRGGAQGKIITVVGKGKMVGFPLVPMLMKEGATVISCNSKTPATSLAQLTKAADIVVTAVGKANLITADMISDGALVIDAGITVDENGKLCGDCDKSMYEKEEFDVTPVPGGVGLVTRYKLMEHVVISAGRRS